MDLFTAIKRRHSVRYYSKKKIFRSLLEKIVDAGRYAPTARGVQPWEFVVVSDAATVKALGGITDHGKFLSTANACIAVFSADTKYYLEDCCAATQNILLAATAVGVGSCWIAGDKKPYCPQINQLLGVPGQYKLVSLIALGFPLLLKGLKPAARRPFEETVHWERF